MLVLLIARYVSSLINEHYYYSVARRRKGPEQVEGNKQWSNHLTGVQLENTARVCGSFLESIHVTADQLSLKQTTRIYWTGLHRPNGIPVAPSIASSDDTIIYQIS